MHPPSHTHRPAVMWYRYRSEWPGIIRRTSVHAHMAPQIIAMFISLKQCAHAMPCDDARARSPARSAMPPLLRCAAVHNTGTNVSNQQIITAHTRRSHTYTHWPAHSRRRQLPPIARVYSHIRNTHTHPSTNNPSCGLSAFAARAVRTVALFEHTAAVCATAHTHTQTHARTRSHKYTRTRVARTYSLCFYAITLHTCGSLVHKYIVGDLGRCTQCYAHSGGKSGGGGGGQYPRHTTLLLLGVLHCFLVGLMSCACCACMHA